MSRIQLEIPSKMHLLLISVVILCLDIGICQAALPRISQYELTRYQAWVKNLQPDLIEFMPRHSYFPGFETVKPEWARMPEGRTVSAASSVMSIEDVLVREWERAELITPQQALGVARSYRLASEYDDAVSWFDRAFCEGGYGYPPPPRLAEEIFATAILTCDSLTITRHLLNVIGYSDLSGYDNAIVLALRHLVAHADWNNLVVLQDKIDGQQDRLDAETRYWYAVSLIAADRRVEALAALRSLVIRRTGPSELKLDQKNWILRTLPDLLYVLGYQAEADPYYRILAESDRLLSGESGDWAIYQVANYEIKAGDYAAARIAFDRLQATESDAPWRARAQKMTRILENLASIRKDGQPYGIDDIHTP